MSLSGSISSVQMRPRFSAANFVDCGRVDSVFRGHDTRASSVDSDCANLVSTKFAHGITLSGNVSVTARDMTIGDVFFLRPEFEMGEVDAAAVVAEMADHFAFGDAPLVPNPNKTVDQTGCFPEGEIAVSRPRISFSGPLYTAIIELVRIESDAFEQRNAALHFSTESSEFCLWEKMKLGACSHFEPVPDKLP